MKSSSRITAIIIGALAGATLGGAAAWAYAKAQEEKNPDRLATGLQYRYEAGAPEFVKIGLAVLALVRQVTELFKPL